MVDRPSPSSPLQPSAEGSPSDFAEPSGQVPEYLTLKEAARQAECSDSTLRRLVKAGEVPHLQEETKTGFRYMFEASTVNVIAHKAAMRRPSGRPSGRRVEGRTLQPSTDQGGLEASSSAVEMAAVRAERDLLKAENARLWTQIDRLTESVTQLALPPSRAPEEEGVAEARPVANQGGRSWWDWFFGRK